MTLPRVQRAGVLAICAVLAVAGVVSACAGPSSGTSPTSDPTPALVAPSISPYTTGVKRDVAYGPNKAQTMDICYPPTPSKSTGAFLLIHGGAWSSGDKSDFESLCGVVARLGYVGATMNYRMFDQHATYADMLADIDLALATYTDTARADGWPISKVALMGVSAGAYLALMYAYTRQPPVPIGFVVGMSTPTDFLDPALIDSADAGKYAELSNLVGVDLTKESLAARQETLRAASPAYRVEKGAPPTILAQGAKDSVVPYSNALSMAARLAIAGVPYDLLTYPNSGHNLADDPAVSNRFLNLFLAYAARYLA